MSRLSGKFPLAEIIQYSVLHLGDSNQYTITLQKVMKNDWGDRDGADLLGTVYAYRQCGRLSLL